MAAELRLFGLEGMDRGTEGNWIWDSYAIGTGQSLLGLRTGSIF
tara:strand:- start:4237 stop:4368 length:132 start_codon:yes stop_codon:yes gene_type:complete